MIRLARATCRGSKRAGQGGQGCLEIVGQPSLAAKQPIGTVDDIPQAFIWSRGRTPGVELEAPQLRSEANRMKRFPMSALGVEKRWLRPAYRFSNSLMAWQCAVCGKIFSITVEEARSAAQLPPPHIEQDFQLHSCERHLFDRFSDVVLRRERAGGKAI